MIERFGFGAVITLRAYGADGALLWERAEHNLVVNVGANAILDAIFRSSGYTSAFYIFLTDGTPTPAAADTMASHAGWAEVTAYSQASRPAYTPAAAAGRAISNASALASFSINANGTVIGGAGLSTSSTKGGTTGTLINIAAFTQGDFTLGSGSTLTVQIDFELS